MTEPEPHDPDAQYDLVMPFVVTKSAGGPYDDEAFVAGWEASFIDVTLGAVKTVAGSFERWVRPGLLPMCDLIAMKHQYKVTSEPWDEHPEAYVRARFEPAP